MPTPTTRWPPADRATGGPRPSSAWCSTAPGPSATRRREPLFAVLIDHQTFLSGTLHPDTVLETVDGGVIPIGVAERWLCDSRWQLLVQGAAGEVLMLGRAERYANRAIRRALAARDRGCAASGCSAPVSHCDAHHVTWWDYEGESNADEMALLCRHHHRTVHAGALEIMMVSTGCRSSSTGTATR